jgi:hypothetical protein
MRAFTVLATLACALIPIAGCSQQDDKIDITPLPTVAAPPYLCGHVPLHAVEQMTGLRNPLAEGSFDLTSGEGLGDGSCGIYQPTGERRKVLDVVLIAYGTPDRVKEEIDAGAKPLPQIMPSAEGYYRATQVNDYSGATAVLVRGKAMLVVDMTQGGEGRNHEADVVALMKLLAPRLITDASLPSPSPEKGS